VCDLYPKVLFVDNCFIYAAFGIGFGHEWRVFLQALNLAPLVVKSDVFFDVFAGLGQGYLGMQVNLILFDASPESL